MTKLPPPYFFECPDHPKDGFVPQRIKAMWPSGAVDTISLCAGVSIFTDSDQQITTAPSEVVLALLDINGKNMTANELRKELDELREKLKRVEAVADEMHSAITDSAAGDAFADAEDMLREALET